MSALRQISPLLYAVPQAYPGKPGTKPRPLAERFWEQVQKGSPDECWPWAGLRDRHGYGHIAAGGKYGGMLKAHRVSWAIANDCEPIGVVAHQCDNPSCVNPAHLWLGTQADNIRDMIAKGRGSEQQKTHCPRGHEYTPENTHINSKGRRNCRACWRKS